MKAHFFGVFAIIVVTCALAAKVPFQYGTLVSGKVDAAMIAAKLKDTRYANMIASFLQMKSNVAPKDNKALFAAFDLVQKAIQKLLDEENQGWTKVSAEYLSFKTSLETSRTDVATQLTRTEASLKDDLKPREERLTKEVEGLQKSLKETNGALDGIQAQYEKDKRNNKELRGDLKAMIEAIDKAAAALGAKPAAPAAGGKTGDAKDKKPDAKPDAKKTAFVEMDALEDFKLSMIELQEKAKNYESPRKHLIDALVQISLNARTSDAAQIIDLLNKIKADLQSQINNLKTASEAAKNAFKEAIAPQKDLLKTYVTKLKDAQKELSKTLEMSAVAKKSVQDLTATKQKWDDTLAELKKGYDSLEAAHKKQIDDLLAELELLKKALEVLSQNGFQRPLN